MPNKYDQERIYANANADAEISKWSIRLSDLHSETEVSRFESSC